MSVARALALVALLICTGIAVPFAGGLTSLPAAAQDACAVDGFTDQAIEIMAPASPGGGWDGTAREIQRVLQETGIAPTVSVYNVPGAGGTIGLSQLVNDESGNDHQLMVMGLVMVGAIATNQSPVTLEEVIPIARLTTEWEIIVVPADSEYQTLDDLLAAFQADPAAISWGGGSAGGTDHLLVGLIAQETGVDPLQVNYIPFSGGGEALAAILGGQVSAGVSGVGEWQDQVESGELRALAVSGVDATSATPVADGEGSSQLAPTLQEQGIDLEVANWRGIVAAPGISAESTACLIDLMDQMHAAEEWTETLASYGWTDFYLAGDEFGTAITEEVDRVTPILIELGLVAE
ncbi:MAG: tripartite tricarboxylate transporter substrate-binding protein [Chloroflexota bacterium]|nr:tripartite tricarboxylate transporter substrate-binding protein [Chloroflexota bacterium]